MPKETKSIPPSALRLYNLRKATGLSRDAIQDRHGIRSPSLRGWETGLRSIKPHKAELFVSIFKTYGINCTTDWILYGKGEDPLEARSQTTDEAYILQEIARFESFYKDSTVMEVTDNCMAPWIRKGDYVGGIFKEPERVQDCFVDQLCIVRTREFGTQIRLVQKTQKSKLYNLISFSHTGELMNVELEAVAVVIFMRRQQEMITGKPNPQSL
ncbi:MAG: helix-turn-helix domain-containing protein [Alphaproteobacteria bacterium]|jgi:transcriptional regulator with XRE-family HTH domain|nr:helix-turn-helix domain-containing protein [Alphaproteobacteria bacterium]